jgi:hypothetical protein
MPEFIPSRWSIRSINPTYKLLAIFHTELTPNRAAGQDRLLGRQPSVTDRWLIVVVKKTFRNSNVFFYNHLYQPECFYEKRYNFAGESKAVF